MATPSTTISSDPAECRFRFEALGTQWEIATREPLDRSLQDRVLRRIDEFDTTYSRFRPDSLVSRIAASPDGGRFAFPADSIALFDLYDRLNAASAGAVDPLVGRSLERLGYDRTYSLAPSSDTARDEDARPSWSRDVVRDGTTLVTRRPLVIDVGAVGKGYVVDVLSEMLEAAGFAEFVVDGSGDLRHAGASGIRVGLEDPFDPMLVIGVSKLQGAALCASAVNRRTWGNGLHHVVDARTGMPVQDVVATWVVADDAATADGLATALFFTDADRLEEVFSFAYVRLFADRRAEISQNFDGEIFSRDHPEHSPRAHRPSARKRNDRATTRSNKVRAALAGLAAAAVMAGCSTSDTDAAPSSTSDRSETRPRPAARPPYADGVYSATGQYGSLPSSITVRVRLADGVITAVTVTPHATDPTSLRLQRRFAAAVPKVVVGKPIAAVEVGRLAGSSGTPDGFNAAIEKIKKKARNAR